MKRIPSPLRRHQGGFTLIELVVVGLVIAVVALLSMPRINGFIIDRKVQPTATDLSEAVMRLRVNAEGAGPTPYASITTAALANTLRDRTTVLTVAGTGAAATLTHGLGATGATVVVAPATITSSGDSWTATLNNVNVAACPGLATALQNTSEIIRINNVVVKSVLANTVYNGQSAQNLCTDRDTNTFVFTFR